MKHGKLITWLSAALLGISAAAAFSAGIPAQAVTSPDGLYEYEIKSNEVTIERETNSGPSEAEENAEMFEGIGEDYDVTLKKETADAWHLRCKKRKDSADEDAPKTMDLVVAKATFLPVSLKATVSGVTVTIHDLRLGVSEKDVTFRLEDFPGAKVVDER